MTFDPQIVITSSSRQLLSPYQNKMIELSDDKADEKKRIIHKRQNKNRKVSDYVGRP